MLGDTLFVMTGMSVVLVWLLIRRDKAVPKLLSLAVGLLVLSPILPATVAVGAQVGLILVALYRCLKPESAGGIRLVVLVLAPIAFWLVLMFHPNVPSLAVGVSGFRKTALWAAGILLGAAVPPLVRRAVEKSVVRWTLAAIALSIGVHFLAPDLVRSIPRAADQYTAQIGGRERLQGFFPGPFHVAMGSVMLVIWGVARIRMDRALALVAIVVGGIACYLTQVRTAIVALLIGIAVLIAVRRGKVGSPWWVLAPLALLAAVVLLVLLQPVLPAGLGILGDLLADSRFQNRFPGYADGLEMIRESPVVGWGTGSAGDTLGDEFAGGRHVTSHNVILKLFVEGGLVGLILWTLALTYVLRRIGLQSLEAALALAMLGALGGFGITGSAVEALPFSLLIAVFVGMALRPPAQSNLNNPSIENMEVGRKT